MPEKFATLTPRPKFAKRPAQQSGFGTEFVVADNLVRFLDEDVIGQVAPGLLPVKFPHVLAAVAEQAGALPFECLDKPLAPEAFLLQDAQQGFRFPERRNAPACPNPPSRLGGRPLWQRVSPFVKAVIKLVRSCFGFSFSSSSFSPRVWYGSRRIYHSICCARREGELRGELLRFPLSCIFPFLLVSNILRVENR